EWVSALKHLVNDFSGTAMAIYVLVHGATAGGWIWQSIPARLRAAGHDAFTLTLTGLGERRHLFSPDITMETHILDVLNVLFFEDLHQVILVGHSYGGAVITGVAEKAAERLSHLVYLDAFVPQDGEAVRDLYDPPVVHTLTEHYLNGGKSLPVNGAEASDPRFTEHPLKTFFQPFHLKNEEYLTIDPLMNSSVSPTGAPADMSRKIPCWLLKKPSRWARPGSKSTFFLLKTNWW
ncbi:MAG: alpha/beta fold hydrolase, partial [Deltaproteobacteria bacterium]|nr:alpha/beta fold hydrolase [Deltaproteobacteria bacterium]